MSNLAKLAVVKKINFAVHKIVMLLTARISRDCLDLPRPALPRLARPRQALPRRAKLLKPNLPCAVAMRAMLIMRFRFIIRQLSL
jgi:hypothetical protein